MTLLTRYSSLADQSSSSPSSDSIATPRNTTYGKSFKKIKCDRTGGSKVMAFLTRYSSLADQSSLSRSSDTKSTSRKTASGNSCEHLSAIKPWDQKLWPFWPVTQVLPCNGLAQHAVYCPLWASQSTHYQGFHPGSPHDFVLGNHTWPQKEYNMLATSTTNKALALDVRFRRGISQSPHLKTSRPRLWYQM
jgi:hypothetical protein